MSDLFSPRFAPPPPSPPPAPPLPPARYVNRATSALARFAQPFIGASRPASAQAHRAGDGGRRIVPAAIPNLTSPLSAQDASHRTGVPISALDISPQRTHAVLAGRDILKTIRVSGTTCSEEFDLRAAVIAHASAHASSFATAQSARLNDNLAAEDVKWSHGNYNSIIATAAANGKIVLYDLNRPGVELALLHEHQRQVHKLAFNPHQGYYLLSASQDATLRLWDLRASGSVLAFRSQYKYHGNADGVRDVKWSPTDGTEFACGTDAGAVQRWDFRKDAVPLLKVSAHRGACQAVDWHPDGTHLASAGSDKTVRVWDFSSVDRRQSPRWSFRAPHPLANVRWRPAVWTPSKSDTSFWETCQMAISYDQEDVRVHIWDLRRPHVPFREIDHFESAPTDMLWHSGDLLWTVGQEGTFEQNDVHFAINPDNRRRTRRFDISPAGEITFCAVRKPANTGFNIPGQSAPGRPSGARRPQRTSGEQQSGSRSTTDDEAGASLPSNSLVLRQTRSWSGRPTRFVEETPHPDQLTLVVRKLDDILANSRLQRPRQRVFCGPLPGRPYTRLFDFLATKYILDSRVLAAEGQPLTFQDLQRGMEYNARVAHHAGLVRTAQTWRIISVALSRDERRRLALVASSQSANSRPGDSTRQATVEEVEDDGLDNQENMESVSRRDFAFPNADIASGDATSSREGRAQQATPQAQPLRAGPSSGAASGSRPGRPTLSGTETPSESLNVPRWNTASSGGDAGLAAGGGRPARMRMPLQLDERLPQASSATPESPASRIRRLGSAESFSVFPASSDDSRRGSPSRSPSRASLTDEGSGRTSRAGPSSATASYHGGSNEPAAGRADAGEPLPGSAGGVPAHDAAEASGAAQQPSAGRRRRQPAVDLGAFAHPTPMLSAAEMAADPLGGATFLDRAVQYYIRDYADTLTPATLMLFVEQYFPHVNIMDDGQTGCVLANLNELLKRRELFVQAAWLRKVCYPRYPQVYGRSLNDIELKLGCAECSGTYVRAANGTGRVCDKCGKPPPPCPVCYEQEPGQWMLCLECGHGGHPDCLEALWAPPYPYPGMCVVEGCLHQCDPRTPLPSRPATPPSPPWSRPPWLPYFDEDDAAGEEGEAEQGQGQAEGGGQGEEEDWLEILRIKLERRIAEREAETAARRAAGIADEEEDDPAVDYEDDGYYDDEDRYTRGDDEQQPIARQATVTSPTVEEEQEEQEEAAEEEKQVEREEQQEPDDGENGDE